MDFGNGRNLPYRSRYEGECKISKDEVCEIEEGAIYMVKSHSKHKENEFYMIDMESGFCQCAAGSSCGPCHHKLAVQKHYQVAEFSAIPGCDKKMKKMYHFLALGYTLEDDHYRPLRPSKTSKDFNTHEDHQSSSLCLMLHL